ncbi:MAG: TfoX/Sxy family protein [Ruminococcus sp.]|nr:TfoX/Sxy family protein [Ruminococcus sp.]
MASTKGYLDFVLEQLSGLGNITYRAMMGEYIIYYQGKIIGGIYDDRLLVKPTHSAKKMMPGATYELPYEGAKELLLIEDIDNRDFLTELFIAMADELPSPAKKHR